MRKFRLVLMALFCAVSVAFVGCDKDDDGSKSTPSSSEIIGSWCFSDSWTEDGEECVDSQVITFKSDGKFTINMKSTVGDTVPYNETATYSYTYDDGVVEGTFIEHDGNDDSWDESLTFKLKKSGDKLYITFCNEGNETLTFKRVE